MFKNYRQIVKPKEAEKYWNIHSLPPQRFFESRGFRVAVNKGADEGVRYERGP